MIETKRHSGELCRFLFGNRLAGPQRSCDTRVLAGMAELADAADSKSAEVHPSWGFDPPSRHQFLRLADHFALIADAPVVFFCESFHA